MKQQRLRLVPGGWRRVEKGGWQEKRVIKQNAMPFGVVSRYLVDFYHPSIFCTIILLQHLKTSKRVFIIFHHKKVFFLIFNRS